MKDESGDTALMKAAEGGHLACLEALINAHADTEVRTPNFGNSALFACAVRGDNGCVKALLDAKANPNIRDVDGNTALMVAALEGKTRCVKLLINARANLESKRWSKVAEPTNGFSKPPFYGTALDYAALNGHSEAV